jgi:hypothetical protein
MGTEVSAVVVSYNTRDLLRECLRSVYASDLPPAEVFVVDNASADGTPEMVAAEFPAVTLIALDRNLGFAGANNVAIRRSRGDRVLLLNPDATIAPDGISGLSRALDRWPRAAAVGPRILNPDGSFQSCGYRFPTVLSELRQSRNVNRVVSWVLGPDRGPDLSTEDREVDWSDGACMLLRREAIAQVGGLDERYFLYTEELDWCFNARKAGWSIVVVPSVTVWHHRGQSSAGTGGGLATSLLVETRLRYFHKNHSLLTAATVAVVNGLGFVKTRHHDPSVPAKLEGIARWRRTLFQDGASTSSTIRPSE